MSGPFTGAVGAFRRRSGDVGFLDRLDDVRGRLIASIIALLVTTAAGFYLVINFDILGVFTAPIQPYLGDGKLKFLSPMDPFFVSMKLAVAVGLVLALPYLLAQFWGVVSPLMRPEERRLLAPSIVASVVLFAAGGIFCYKLVVPVMLQFTLGFQTESLEHWIVVGEYLAVVIRMVLAFGFAFELPVVILLATVLGIVTPGFLADKRRYAIAIIVISAALITPSADLSSMLLLSIPVWFLYELSIVLSRAVVAGRARAST
jgi:sec-independent protein translocase protein TatC